MASVQSSWCLVSIDGEQAVLGRATCPEDFKVVERVTCHAHSRTRRGGQSAPRFQRQRQGAEKAFLKHVCEKIRLSGDANIIIGGKSENKHRLLAELEPARRACVRKLLALNCDSSTEACRALSREIQGASAQLKSHAEEAVLQQFMELMERDMEESYCYGMETCEMALRLGAADSLLLAEGVHGKELRALAEATQAKVVRVASWTEAGHRFCAGVQVGALLRWPIAALEPETWCADDRSDCSTEADESGSEAPSEGPDMLQGELESWMVERLCSTGSDRSSAEALTCCVSIMLDCDNAPEERIEEICELLRNEGVEETLLLELASKISGDTH